MNNNNQNIYELIYIDENISKDLYKSSETKVGYENDASSEIYLIENGFRYVAQSEYLDVGWTWYWVAYAK